MSMLGNFTAWLLNIIRAKGDLIVGNSAGKPSRLPVGTDAHVLTADSSAHQGLSYKPVSGSGGLLPITTRGDIIVGHATGIPIRKPRGTHGQVFTTDEGSADGTNYKDPNDLALQGDPSGVWYLGGGVDLDNNFLGRLVPGDAGEPATISLPIPGSMTSQVLLAISAKGSPGRTYWLPGLHRVILGLAVSTPGTTLRITPQIGTTDQYGADFTPIVSFDTIYPANAGDSTYVRNMRVAGDAALSGLPSRRMALVLNVENTSTEANQLTVFGGFGYNHPTRIETFTSPAPSAEPSTLDGFDRDATYFLESLDPVESGFPARMTAGDGLAGSFNIGITQAEGVGTHKIAITKLLTPRLVRWPAGRAATRLFYSATLPAGNIATVTPLVMRYSEDLTIETFVCALDAFAVEDGAHEVVLYGQHGDIETDEGQRLGLVLQTTVNGPDGLNLTIRTGGDYPSRLYTGISPQEFLPVQQGALPVAVTDRSFGFVNSPTVNGQILTSDLAQPGHMKWASPSGGGYVSLLDIDFTALPNLDISADGDYTIGGHKFSVLDAAASNRGWIRQVTGLGIKLEARASSYYPGGMLFGPVLFTMLDRQNTGYPGQINPDFDPLQEPHGDYLIQLKFNFANFPSNANTPGLSVCLNQQPINSPIWVEAARDQMMNVLNFGGINGPSGIYTPGDGGLYSWRNDQPASVNKSGLQTGPGAQDTCAIIRVKSEALFFYSGSFGAGTEFPSIRALTYRGSSVLCDQTQYRRSRKTCLAFQVCCQSFGNEGGPNNAVIYLERLQIQHVPVL